MVTLQVQETVKVPSDVTVDVCSRTVCVTGKYGKIQSDFKHISVEIAREGDTLYVTMWNAKSRDKSSVRTLCSHIENMIKGVRHKFLYKMRLVYSHFPININVTEDGRVVEIRHFLGEKRTRVVRLDEGVTCVKSDAVKDELLLSGIDIRKVSRSCSLLRQNALVRNKDIRQFLDGIYVSEKGLVDVVE
uniref:Large ribosomal subunit protein uL6 n=1 Tax=Dermatophagoides pteronyssinus TaxID=6956 RepID=A0A6P6YKF2_DERPT|nr:60S ribosomal protein L9-like [Dermatophagoides pteronyssinus]